MSIRDHKELEEQSFPSDSVQILDWIFSGKNDEKRVAVALRTKPGSGDRGEMNWRRERERQGESETGAHKLEWPHWASIT